MSFKSLSNHFITGKFKKKKKLNRIFILKKSSQRPTWNIRHKQGMTEAYME